jgi:hypothetical protein
MAISNVTVSGVQYDVLASTLRILRDKEVDNTFRNIPLLEACQRHGNIEKTNGGSYVDAPVILTDHSSITSLVSGYESINLAVKDPLRTANYKWCDFIAPVVLADTEALSNKGERAVVKILEARLKSVMGMLKREWEKQIVAGTSTVLTNLESLYYGGSGGTQGWFSQNAFGAQTKTIGGISSGSFATSWQHQTVTSAAYDASTANLSQAMTQIYIDSQIYAPKGNIDIILMSPIAYKRYKEELEGRERYTSVASTKDMAGKLVLMFNGAACYVEPFMVGGLPSFVDGAAATSGKFNHVYMLNSELFNLYFDKDAFFTLGDMERISGYAAASANIMTRCQMTTQNLSGHGIINFPNATL